MFRATAILAILACAAAFAPSARVARSGALKMSFESEIGSQAPLGFWDPLGLLKDADQERFDRLRYVENKHGRISMLAVLGHLTTTSGVHLPGDIAFGTKFAEIDSGLAGLFGPNAVPQQGLTQLIIFIGAIDLAFTNYAQPEVEQACQDKMDSLNWSEKKQTSKKSIELNNGRAAQMGILALMVHEKLDGNPYIINSLLGSPVAFNQ